MRATITRLLVGLLVAAISLLTVEGLLRLLAGPPPPPVRVYSVQGEIDTYLQIEDGIARTTYQLVEPIAPFPVKKQGPRVAVLGGSSVHIGDGTVSTEKEFASLLEEATGVEVLNLGTPGVDSFDVVALVAELEAIELDAIIVYTGHNDLGNAFFQQRYGDIVGTWSVRALPFLERSQLFCQLRRVLTGPAGSEHPENPVTIRRDTKKRLGAAQKAAAIRFLEANLRQVIWRCQQRGLPLVLVVPASDLMRSPSKEPCPEHGPCAKMLWREAMSIRERDPDRSSALLRQARDADPVALRAPTQVEEMIRGFAREPGVWVVDAAGELPRYPGLDVPRRRMFSDHIHLSAAGHGALTGLLVPVLEAVLATPPR